MTNKSSDIIGAKAGATPSKPYIQQDTVGSTQTAEIVYGIGDGENEGLINGLNSIILDGTRVIGSSGEVNYTQVKFEERKGLIDQEALKLIEDTSVERTLNLEVRDEAPVVSTFNNNDVDKYVVRISIPQLMQNKDNGDSIATAVTYAIEAAVDGGAYSEILRNTVYEKITNGFEIDHEFDAPAGSLRTLRVRRITAASSSQLLANKIFVAGITEVINAKFSHPTLHHIGLVFNAEQFNNIPKVVFHYKGRKIKVPTNYDPVTRKYTGIWNGTFKVVYSNNPAWVLYDILTDRRSGLGRRLTADLIDKWELYQIGIYCDELVPDGKGAQEPRFVCNNLILNSKQDAYQVIRDIASIFRGQSFWNGTQIITRADAPRDIDYAISMANVISYSYSGTASDARHNVVKAQYYDRDNENKAAYEYATDYASIRETESINELEVRAFGCDSAGQAQRLARYVLLSEQTETRILAAKVSLEGFVNMQLGDIFAWSDRFLAGADNGGRVVSVAGKVLTLDRAVTSSAKVGDTIFVNTASGKANTRKITAVAGNKVTLDTELATTEPEFVWVIDSVDLSLLYFKLDDYKVNTTDNTVDIVGIQHVASKYGTIDTETALEAPLFSKVEIETLRAPENVTINFNVKVEQGLNVADIYVAWQQVKGATRYTVEFRRENQAWRILGTVTGVTHTIENVTAGIYEVRVRASDSIGNASPFGYSPALSVSGSVLPPPALASIRATGKLFAIQVDWTYPAGAEASLAAVVEYTNQDPTTIGAVKQKLNVTYPQTSFTFNGLSAHAKLWVRGAILDKYNQEGAYTSWVNATADSQPDEILEIISGHISEGTLDQSLKGKIDGALGLAGEANSLASQANAAASNAQNAADQAAVKAQEAASTANQATVKAQEAANAVAQEVYDRQVAVTGEAATRREAVIALNDGLTQETNARTDGDATLFSNINTYKASNDNALASVRNQTTVNTDALSSQAEQLTQLDAGLTDTAQLLSSNIVRVNDIDGKVESHAEQLTNINASLQGKADANVLNSLSSTVTEIDGKVVANTQELSAQSTRLANAELGVTNNASAISKTYTKTEADEVIAGKIESYDANLVIGGTNLMEYTSGNAVIYGVHITYDAVTNSFIKPSGAISYTAFRLDSFRPKIGEVYTVSGYLYIDGNPATPSNYWSPSSVINRFQKNIGNVVANSDGYFFGTFEIVTIDEWLALHFLYPDPVIFDETTHTLAFKDLQLEKGSKPSAYSKPSYELTKTLNANANAIQTVTAEVSRIDGVTTAHSGQLTSLSASIDTINGNLIRKADATALNELSADVSDINGRVVAQALQTTNLISRVEGAEGSILNVQHTVSELDASTSTALQQLKSSTEDTGEISRLLNGAAAIFEDFTFSLGFNGVEIYNNLYNGTVVAAWQDKTPDNPIVATRQLGFTHTGAANPAHGGFYQAVDVRPNAVFVHKFVAKLPIGYAFNPASNAIGDGSENYILGSAAGTGKFETYYIVVRAGATGHFSSAGFVYVTGNGLPLSWVLASATIYDCSDSKLVPTSVSNAIATAQSTANTATSNLSALAGRTDTLQSQLSTVSGAVATKLDATVINDYYTRVEADEAAAGEVRKFEANLSIGGTNLWSTTNASQYVELGAASFQLVDTASEYYQIHKQNSGLTRVGFTSLLVAPTTIITSGDEYVLSFYAHTSSAEARLSKIYCYFGGGSTFIAYEPTEVLNNSGWTRFEIKLRANGGDTSQLAQLLVFDLDDVRGFAAGSIFAIRDVQMQRGNKATAYSKANDLLAKQAAANATAIQQTKSDVIAVDNRVTASSANLDQVSARADNALKLLKVEDTRHTNATPRWYWDNYPYRTVKEFKENTYIGVGDFLGYAFCYLETDVYYGDPSGGAIIQTATSASNPADYVQRVSTGLDTWGDWSQPLKQLKTNIEGVAYATQLLNSRVDSVDGRITAEAEETSNLFASLNQKIDLSVTNKDALVDLTAARYNQDTYYPVGINLNENKRHNIQINTALNNLSHPYWATHGGGFSVTCGWEVNRTGWGAAAPDRVVNVFSYGFTDRSPIGGLDQIIQPSWEVVWLRGGGVYNISIPRTSSIIYGDNNGTLYWTDGYYSATQLAKAYDADTVPVAVNQLSAATASAVNTLKINVQSINGVQTAHAEQLSNLSTTVGNNTATISTQQTSINGVSAVHALKIDNNGVIAGYGLVSELINGVVKSQFGINADSFYVGSPTTGKKPFVVIGTGGGTINGVTVPAGTYIDTLMVADATINLAHINTASIGSLSALSANLGTFTSTNSSGTMTVSGAKLELKYPNGVVGVYIGL